MRATRHQQPGIREELRVGAPESASRIPHQSARAAGNVAACPADDERIVATSAVVATLLLTARRRHRRHYVAAVRRNLLPASGNQYVVVNVE